MKQNVTPLGSGTNQWKGRVRPTEPWGEGRVEGKEGGASSVITPTSHTHRHLFQGAGPPANNLGQAFECFIIVWIFQRWEFSWAKLTKWLKSPLYVLLSELLDTLWHSHLPLKTKNNLRNSILSSDVLVPTSFINATIFYFDRLGKIYNLPKLEGIVHHFQLPIRKAFYKHVWFSVIYLSCISKYQNS